MSPSSAVEWRPVSGNCQLRHQSMILSPKVWDHGNQVWRLPGARGPRQTRDCDADRQCCRARGERLTNSLDIALRLHHNRWTSEASSGMPTAIRQQLPWWPVAKLMSSHSSLTGFQSKRQECLQNWDLVSHQSLQEDIHVDICLPGSSLKRP